MARKTPLPGQDPIFTINPEHGTIILFPAEADREAQRLKFQAGISIERQLLVARNIVNIMDMMSHVSMLNGLDVASETDKHRPQLIEAVGGSELKLNSRVNESFSKARRLEHDIDVEFMFTLGLLGVVNSYMNPEERIREHDKAWDTFSSKYSGPEGQRNRDRSRDKFTGYYRAYTGREMPRSFRKTEKEFAEQRRVKKLQRAS